MASKSNEGRLIGIIVGVVLACVVMLLIIVCYCCYRRRSQTTAAAEAAAGPTVGPTEDSVYVHGLRVGSDKAAPNSPDHLDKMRKLQAMTFARTKSSPFGKNVGNSPGAAGTSPEAIGAKGFAFPNLASPRGGEAFGSPVSPGGVGLISQLFSTKSGGPQVSPPCNCPVSILCFLPFLFLGYRGDVHSFPAGSLQYCFNAV